MAASKMDKGSDNKAFARNLQNLAPKTCSTIPEDLPGYVAVHYAGPLLLRTPAEVADNSAMAKQDRTRGFGSLAAAGRLRTALIWP